MTLRVLILVGMLFGPVVGCTRSTRSNDDRYRGMIPTGRSKERDKPIAAKPIDRAGDAPLIAPPIPDERPAVPVDFAKTPAAQPIIPVAAPNPASATATDPTPPRILERVRDRRDERRDERNDRRNPGEEKPEAKPDDSKPALPSPFAKDRNPKPAASGGDFPSPGTIATPRSESPKIEAPSPAAKVDKLAEVKAVYALCKQKWDGLSDYEARLVRREVIGGKESPSEEMIFRFRKSPYSVYTKNTGSAGRGRETMYVAGPNAKMHIVTGEGDNRLVGAGFYTQVAPDDRMVTAKSRHKITEGAVGRTVEMLGKAIGKSEAGQFDGLRSLGLVKRPEFEERVAGIEAVLPPGQDPELPKGGRREVYFDATPRSPSYGLPVLIRLLEGDRELEYYCFSQFKCPANFTDSDFDPSRFSKRR
jgi:hypothetical protein